MTISGMNWKLHDLSTGAYVYVYWRFSTKGVKTNVQRKVNDYEVFVLSRESLVSLVV
jgi:hypothetical protein